VKYTQGKDCHCTLCKDPLETVPGNILSLTGICNGEQNLWNIPNEDVSLSEKIEKFLEDIPKGSLRTSLRDMTGHPLAYYTDKENRELLLAS
jgi:hypothetical protein